jgi:hypothetical protein
VVLTVAAMAVLPTPVAVVEQPISVLTERTLPIVFSLPVVVAVVAAQAANRIP